MVLIIASWLESLPIRFETELFPPVIYTVRDMPIVAHVEAKMDILGLRRDLRYANLLSVCTVRPVDPGAVGTETLGFKFCSQPKNLANQ